METIFTRRFEADRIASQVPVKLMHLEGLYELFLSKFAYSTLDLQMHHFEVHFSMKSTYRTLPFDEDDDLQNLDAGHEENERNSGGDTHSKLHWDDDCPWSEWYSAEDPVKGFELIVTWSEKMVESVLEMAELENASPHDAAKWMILPVLSPNLSEGKSIGFSSQLALLISSLDMSFNAQFMEDFVSAENPGSDNLKSSLVVPPPTVLDRVFKDLFHKGPFFFSSSHAFIYLYFCGVDDVIEFCIMAMAIVIHTVL
uniref:Rab3 GTPase-activating protein catalytic subunit isoform X1 n=1 Tax=Rhizophora mucronata TaxID=61149 RepID=A0A2P2M4T3_RHIMU